MKLPKTGTCELAPSILSADFANLASEIAQVTALGIRVIHLDVTAILCRILHLVHLRSSGFASVRTRFWIRT
jgi:hypothetical protein